MRQYIILSLLLVLQGVVGQDTSSSTTETTATSTTATTATSTTATTATSTTATTATTTAATSTTAATTSTEAATSTTTDTTATTATTTAATSTTAAATSTEAASSTTDGTTATTATTTAATSTTAAATSTEAATSTLATSTEAATTEATTTKAATTEAATTEALTTEAPTTEAPTTEAPTTEAPTTEAPTTEAPTTEAPTTEAPTTEAPTTEAPITEEATTNAHFNPEVNQICPTNAGVNDKIRTAALDAQNWRRSLLAAGEVIKRNGVYMPQGGNIMRLKYDCGLEISARNKAASCSLADNTNPAYQENLYEVAKAYTVDRPDAMRQSIQYWWKQVSLDDPIGAAVTFRAKHATTAIRSFTRMAWATTTNVGCAVKSCGDYWHSVCHYSPPGNIVGRTIYTVGAPCSSCPSGTYCDTSYGLCHKA